MFHKHILSIQCSPVMMLCLGSKGLDSVMSDSCYKEAVLQKNYRKKTMKWLWLFSYNSFVKGALAWYGKLTWESAHAWILKIFCY